MSNVVQLNAPSRKQREADRLKTLLACFSDTRRFGDDVFWLKENAELLNILECTGAKISPDAWGAHERFYADVEKRLGFFPQYYRFLLSICLDLEDLGMEGQKGETLVNWVNAQGMIHGELSDLQRGEARRLMLRRGVDPMPNDMGLDDRLRSFVNRSATFAMPNKKAAYELTHIVFYLSEYGRKDPMLGAEARRSLDFAGTLAFLDQNADLLAEVCIAMHYAGFAPPDIWQSWLLSHARRFDIVAGDHASAQDDYHELFVCNWFLACEGHIPFEYPLLQGRMAFYRPDTPIGPLRDMSECMFRLADERRASWSKMRPLVTETLGDEAYEVLEQAEKSSLCFETFFAGFARIEMQGVSL